MQRSTGSSTRSCAVTCRHGRSAGRWRPRAVARGRRRVIVAVRTSRTCGCGSRCWPPLDYSERASRQQAPADSYRRTPTSCSPAPPSRDPRLATPVPAYQCCRSWHAASSRVPADAASAPLPRCSLSFVVSEARDELLAEVVVVMPAYNAGRTLRMSRGAAEGHGESVILVDDGSTDNPLVARSWGSRSSCTTATTDKGQPESAQGGAARRR